jgi:transcriptional regulator with XRE-family HTH domain
MARSPAPTWPALRNHYVALWRASGLSQAEVARRGGLSGNNAISRLIVNAKLGPSVANFMKAVHGLGLSLVDFLAGVEESHGATPSLTACPTRSALPQPYSRHGRDSPGTSRC